MEGLTLASAAISSSSSSSSSSSDQHAAAHMHRRCWAGPHWQCADQPDLQPGKAGEGGVLSLIRHCAGEVFFGACRQTSCVSCCTAASGLSVWPTVGRCWWLRTARGWALRTTSSSWRARCAAGTCDHHHYHTLTLDAVGLEA